MLAIHHNYRDDTNGQCWNTLMLLTFGYRQSQLLIYALKALICFCLMITLVLN